MSSHNRVPKTDHRQFRDLCTYTDILGDSLELFSQGRTYHYKTMLWCLRAMVIDNKAEYEAILVRTMRKHNSTAKIIFKGMVGIPQTNPLSKDRIVTLAEYLNTTQLVVGAKNYSLKGFLHELANTEAAHASTMMDQNIAFGEQILIGGIPANMGQVKATAATIYSLACTVLNEIKIHYQEPVT